MADLCIPLAQGVPGFWGEPPYWLPGHPTFTQNTDLDDPRWRGAYRRNYNEDVIFRALHHTEGTDKSLYLSWQARVPELNDGFDRLYVGFNNNNTGDAMVIFIQVHGAVAGVATAALVFAIDVYTSSGGGAWTSLGSDPAWINTNTLMWHTLAGTPSDSWTVQMRVPNITTAGSLTDAAGPLLGDDFEMWFGVWGATPLGAIVILTEEPSLGTSAIDYLGNNYPAVTNWADVSTIGTACPTTGGVAFQWGDIGTTNSPASKIEYAAGGGGTTNVFFARPRNYTGSTINSGAISARFRIADWGSVAPAAWVDIPGGGNVVSTQNITPVVSPAASNELQPINFNWQLSAGDIATFITGGTNHHCILVELDGPGLTFFNESIYRNMDFVVASTFRREAAINVKGLEGIHLDPTADRDVYLWIEKLNMPSVILPGQGPPDEVSLPPLFDKFDPPAGIPLTHLPPGEEYPGDRQVSRREAIAMAKRGELSDEMVDTFMPIYRMHVYYDTGERVRVAGKEHPVLRPQTYFGYLVEHEGQLVGWQDELEAPASAQLKKLADNFYQIVVPNNGVAKITTIIEAREPKEVAEGLLQAILAWFRKLPRWLQILLLLILLIIIILLIWLL